jgi:hypothetical protein
VSSDPNARPTFGQLVSILEDAKPEQVQAVEPAVTNDKTMLEFEGNSRDFGAVVGSSQIFEGQMVYFGTMSVP